MPYTREDLDAMDKDVAQAALNSLDTTTSTDVNEGIASRDADKRALLEHLKYLVRAELDARSAADTGTFEDIRGRVENADRNRMPDTEIRAWHQERISASEAQLADIAAKLAELDAAIAARARAAAAAAPSAAAPSAVASPEAPPVACTSANDFVRAAYHKFNEAHPENTRNRSEREDGLLEFADEKSMENFFNQLAKENKPFMSHRVDPNDTKKLIDEYAISTGDGMAHKGNADKMRVILDAAIAKPGNASKRHELQAMLEVLNTRDAKFKAQNSTAAEMLTSPNPAAPLAPPTPPTQRQMRAAEPATTSTSISAGVVNDSAAIRDDDRANHPSPASPRPG